MSQLEKNEHFTPPGREASVSAAKTPAEEGDLPRTYPSWPIMCPTLFTFAAPSYILAAAYPVLFRYEFQETNMPYYSVIRGFTVHAPTYQKSPAPLP